MVLIILTFLLVAGIAFFQAVQGIFSSLIMATLTILCAAFAFQYYEPLAHLLYSRQPSYADAVSLYVLFAVPLIGLRFLADRFISGNVLVGAWPDRIAGGAMGLITGMIVAGILTLCAQMMPTGPRWLLYRPFTDGLQVDQELAPFYPDHFALGLADTLSGGALGGGDANFRFSNIHDRFLLDYWAARNQMTQVREVDNEKVTERIGRLDAPTDSLTVLGVYDPNDPAWRTEVPADPLISEGDPSKIIIVRVGVSEQARDLKDGWWRLPATHFRLVTRKEREKNAPPVFVSHYPVAYLTAFDAKHGSGAETDVFVREPNPSWKVIPAPKGSENETKIAQVGKLAVARPWKEKEGNQLVIDWIFRIGRDEAPDFIAFRRVAQQPMRPAVIGMPEPKQALDRNAGQY